jgi:hypothetical protein
MTAREGKRAAARTAGCNNQNIGTPRQIVAILI